jgi:site-specific DNA-methyltransferase (adenine-specific)
VLIPTLFAASLAYGHNMLRPERTTPRWRVRNQIVWARPNPPVGALGDKYRPATSYVTVATKSPARYFDLDAVRNMNNPDRMDEPSMHNTKSVGAPGSHLASAAGEGNWNPAGAPPLDYWVIPTHPYPGAHYATFPPDLVVKPVKSMCPQRVCRVCGEPSRRITSDPDTATTPTTAVA